MGRRRDPPEFRRKVLDLVEAGRPIAEIAQPLGISAESIYTWRRQDRIDKGLLPGLSSHEHDERWRPAPGSPSWRPSLRSPAGPPSCSGSKHPRSTVRGHPGDGRRGAIRAGLLPSVGGLGVRLLRLVEPAAVAASDPPCPAHRRDATGPYCLPPDLWQPPSPRRAHPRSGHQGRLPRRGAAGCAAPACRASPAAPSSAAGRDPRRPPPTWSSTSSPASVVTHVTDITQHPTREGKVYCAVTVDAWLTPGGRLVHRRHSNRGPGHQRAKDPGCPPWVASAAAWLTP
jgi:transposase